MGLSNACAAPGKRVRLVRKCDMLSNTACRTRADVGLLLQVSTLHDLWGLCFSTVCFLA